MTDKKGYYTVLHLDETAGEQEIKAAFRREVKLYHPDRNDSPEARETYLKLNEAYRVLTDPDGSGSPNGRCAGEADGKRREGRSDAGTGDRGARQSFGRIRANGGGNEKRDVFDAELWSHAVADPRQIASAHAGTKPDGRTEQTAGEKQRRPIGADGGKRRSDGATVTE